MNKAVFAVIAIALYGATLHAASPGGLDKATVDKIRATYRDTPHQRAIHNAIAANSIDRLAVNAANKNNFDTHFSHKVKSKGITDQKSSGRCWLFTGLNVLRSQMMAQHNLPELTLSQNYNFFWDQLEKSNLFLQSIIDTADRSMDDKTVEWLFKNPLSDGGQYTGLSDNISKYGVVPSEVMVETFSSSNTSRMRNLIGLKLKEWGLELRKSAAAGTGGKALADRKTEMLGEVYKMLALTLGEPPTEFSWSRKDRDGNIIDSAVYTPQSFYATYAGNDLKNDYVMLMNDPTREYYRLYEIDFDRHTYDGQNWTYVNLPVEDIKEMAIASIKDSTMMYFSCDVGKCFDRERGLLDVNHFDYGSLFDTGFPMDKADRIRTFASSSSHAMTLMAVDLDKDGRPKKWMVENSWGPGANNGHLIMTDRWFDEYMFRPVVNKKYLTAKAASVLDTKPILLPAWDPMFAEEQ